MKKVFLIILLTGLVFFDFSLMVYATEAGGSWEANILPPIADLGHSKLSSVGSYCTEPGYHTAMKASGSTQYNCIEFNHMSCPNGYDLRFMTLTAGIGPTYHTQPQSQGGFWVCKKPEILCPGGQIPDPGDPTKCMIPTGGSVSGYQMQINIPCDPNIGDCPEATTPAGYVSRLYTFALMIAGLVAFGALVFGAVKYILSAGNVVDQQDAKDQMKSAIIGLLLLLGAYLILYTINPDLVSLRNPEAVPIQIEEVSNRGRATSGTSNVPVGAVAGPPGGTAGPPAGSTVPIGGAVIPLGGAAARAATCPQTGQTFTLSVQEGCTRSSDCYESQTRRGYWACFACDEPTYRNIDGVCVLQPASASTPSPSEPSGPSGPGGIPTYELPFEFGGGAPGAPTGGGAEW